MAEGIDRWQELFEPFNRRDWDAALELFDPEVELYPALVGPGVRSRYQGRDEVTGFFETITDVWESLTVELEEVIDKGDRVIAVENWRARGREGIEINTRLVDVYRFRDGLVVRAEGFRDKEEALEAAGLSE
jgi:ketosteroid isomerase-like protein